MKLQSAELRSLVASLPWKVDADDARDLDAGFDAFADKANARDAIPSLYVTSASHFSTLVPASMQDGDAWVLWLPHLDPFEIEELAHKSPTILHDEVSRERDVRLGWCTALWCFMAYEATVLASLRKAHKLGYVTVIFANNSRVALNAVRVDDDFVVELVTGGIALQRDTDNIGADADGRLMFELKPEPYKP